MLADIVRGVVDGDGAELEEEDPMTSRDGKQGAHRWAAAADVLQP